LGAKKRKLSHKLCIGRVVDFPREKWGPKKDDMRKKVPTGD